MNFTNPSGLVTEALQKYAADVPSVGVCNVPIGVKMHMVQELEKSTGKEIALERTERTRSGINHLSGTAALRLTVRRCGPSCLLTSSLNSKQIPIRNGILVPLKRWA